MDYTPRFYQPFTLHEAIALGVSVITEEISRLQLSLQKLTETQELLKEEQDDPEIKKAFEDNQQVIGSQKERISILKMALTEKGITGGPHYDLQPPSRTTTDGGVKISQQPVPEPAPFSLDVNDGEEEDVGIFL